MLAHNARIYEIPPCKLRLIQGDAISVMTSYRQGMHVSVTHKPNAVDNHRSFQTGKDFVIGDLNCLPKTLDVVFLSPPWGGPDYIHFGSGGFNLSDHIKVHSTLSADFATSNIDCSSQQSPPCLPVGRCLVTDGKQLIKISASATERKAVVLFLPRNINGISVGQAAQSACYCGELELERNVVNEKLKAVTAYLGMS